MNENKEEYTEGLGGEKGRWEITEFYYYAKNKTFFKKKKVLRIKQLKVSLINDVQNYVLLDSLKFMSPNFGIKNMY